MGFSALVEKYQPNINGIIHVGAHYGYEIYDYIKHGVEKVSFFEPVSHSFDVLQNTIHPYRDKVVTHKVALGNARGNVIMNISDNEAQSSSILSPKVHLLDHPDVKFTTSEEVQLTKLDDYNYDYNFLVIDVQGFELEVLKGSSETLSKVDYIYCEVSKDELYAGGPLITDIDSYLDQYSFKRVEIDWWSPTTCWGNAFYIKEKNLMKKRDLSDLPPIYYISLEESFDRRDKLEKNFRDHNIAKVSGLISKRFTECNDVVTGNHVDHLKSTSKGCTISHLKNIKTWLETSDSETAIFIEDDLMFETSNYWNFEWSEFVNELPEDWDVIQLIWIRSGIGSIEFRERFPDDWSVTAFMITRNYGRKLLRNYYRGDNHFHFDTDKNPTCESIIYDLGKTYTFPLFVEDASITSTFGNSPDYQEHMERTGNELLIDGQGEYHHESSQRILDWWKTSGKRKNIKGLFAKKELFPNDYDWGDFDQEAIRLFKVEFELNKIYERYYKVKSSDVVVDIGASVGSFTYSILDKSPSIVYCVEPSRDLFNCLVKNTSKFSINQPIVYVNKAIGNNREDIKIFSGGKNVYGGNNNFDMISFKNFIEEYKIDKIDFLKLDCEGGEYDIFTEDNIDWILKNVKNISAEFHLTYPGCKEKFKKFRDQYLELFDDYVIFSCGNQNVANGLVIDVTQAIRDKYFFDYYWGELMFYTRS